MRVLQEASTQSTWATRARSLKRISLPAVLAFGLLAVQVAIPWLVSSFATEDGPSHLYTAVVVRNLLLHRHSAYGAVYSLNRHLVPDWGTTILLAIVEGIVGTARAERVMMDLCLILGFFAFSYAVKSLAPQLSPWTPLGNFLIQTWFLWLGFYNFYLGMVLTLFIVGYYIRIQGILNLRRGIILSLGLIGLYLTHLLGAAVAALTLGLLAVWTHWIAPAWLKNGSPVRFKQIAGVAAAALPVFELGLAYTAETSAAPLRFTTGALNAFLSFPMHVFTTAAGMAGNQLYIWPAILSFIVIAILTMTREEWASPRGGLVLAALAVFLLYLFVPDTGFGGSLVKIRFAWPVFLIGGLLPAACGAGRVRAAAGVYIAGFLIANLVATTQAAANSSDAIEDYLAVAKRLPVNAHLMRLRYQTPDLPGQYGMQDIGRDPLFHLDAYIAAQCRCIDLTDYQASSLVFPVVFNQSVGMGQQSVLWGMEGPGDGVDKQLAWLRDTLPVPVDYVLVVADSSSAGPSLSEARHQLASWMHLVSKAGSGGFVEVFQRTANK